VYSRIKQNKRTLKQSEPPRVGDLQVLLPAIPSTISSAIKVVIHKSIRFGCNYASSKKQGQNGSSNLSFSLSIL
jgi:hypothetical protein